MERLKQLRENKKLTQLNLGMELGLSQETISGYETGKAVPPADVLVKLADIFDASIDYILERTDVKSTLRTEELSKEESDILLIYRKQNDERKACIHEMLTGLNP